MKPLAKLVAKHIIVLNLFTVSAFYLSAQCNVNDKYDKIISGYHSSIALKDNGVYCTWGSDMKSAGTADQLLPQDINVTNYPAITGAILKAALGGKNAGAAVDQAILLTTDGLWAWGVAGNVISKTAGYGPTTNAFARTSTTSLNGFNSFGLPSTLTPSDIQSMFATYQTLILVTKIVAGTGGDVWILTQTTQAIEGNNGTATVAGTSKWCRLWKSATAGDYLTNVISVRGQNSAGTNPNFYNAFMAQTAAGLVYTWGNTTYLGDNTAAAPRTYATLMTMPTEAGSPVIPKMIGVTGGIGTTATTKNTYYVLSNTGNLYAMGDNNQKQCGDFTTSERTGWVQVKKTSAAADYLTNVNFFSCQEHNNSYPAIAAVTTTGALYTWGNNSSGMLARSDNGIVGGPITANSTFDPGVTAGISGVVISAEMGGHTLVYLKEGTNQFCYAGHYTNGSMGDNAVAGSNNGASTAANLTINCSTTPTIAICGYVPVAASTVNSVISTALATITADGTSFTTITVQLKDASGVNLTASGGTVTIYTTSGTVGTVIDNGNGTYTAILTSAAVPGSTTLSFTINGTAATGAGSSVAVNFASALALTWLNANAYRQSNGIKINWTTANEINVKDFKVERSLNGIEWNTVIDNIPAKNLSTQNRYEVQDNTSITKKLYYRVRQMDIDGHFTYSNTMFVAAQTPANGSVTIFPVPAKNSFQLGNAGYLSIKEIKLVNTNGSLVKSWKNLQAVYDITEIPAGIYIVSVVFNDGNTQLLKLNKQ